MADLSFRSLKVFIELFSEFTTCVIMMREEKDHGQEMAMLHDELECVIVIAGIGLAFQVLGFIQIFYIELIISMFIFIITAVLQEGRHSFKVWDTEGQ